MDCEICGQSEVACMVRIDHVVFSACSECATSGTIVSAPTVMRKAPATRPAGPELMVSPEFGKLVLKARNGLGLKQEELAKKLNEKLAVVSAVESGKRTPDITLARKLENFLKIKLIEEI